MPGFLRGRRRKFEKLSERRLYLNSLLLEKGGRIYGEKSVKLKECEHNRKIELEIPNWNCLDCIWEKMATDDEYDPKNEEYYDDWYAK